MSQPIFSTGQRIVFIGDSITDAGRLGEAAPYGWGYVALARAFLIARYPELGLRFVNHGVSGNTIRDLARRWQRDVIEAAPDWLSVKIGINDVWRSIEGLAPGDAVPLDEYEQTYERLLARTRERTSARLILVEPYVIETDHSDPFRRKMDMYVEAVGRLAQRHEAVLVRTQAAFDEALAHQLASFWAPDRVHPTLPGHAVIARVWLRATGYGDV
jgi:lysophospholipase L1-like esterase